MPGFSWASIAASEIELSSPSPRLPRRRPRSRPARRALASAFSSASASSASGGAAAASLGHRGLGLLEAGAAIGRVEIDDVAQQHLAFVERVAPADAARAIVSGLSQMPPIIISRPASMRLAIAISPSRDNSSTEPISRRYIRTGSSVRPMSSSTIAAGLALAVLGLGLGRLLALLALDDVDAELGQHRHRVLDLLRGHLVRRQRGVQLVIGQVAALLAARHHLLDRGGDRVEQRRFGRLLPGFRRFRRGRRLARHSTIPKQVSHRLGRGRA